MFQNGKDRSQPAKQLRQILLLIVNRNDDRELFFLHESAPWFAARLCRLRLSATLSRKRRTRALIAPRPLNQVLQQRSVEADAGVHRHVVDVGLEALRAV